MVNGDKYMKYKINGEEEQLKIACPVCGGKRN